MPHYYPIFMNLEFQTVLVVGGGAVALRKVQTLLAHGAIVRIVAPHLIQELQEMINGHTCLWTDKEYSSEDIQDAILVFSCTEKKEVNDQVACDSKTNRRLVNVVDDSSKCSFIVPSTMEKGDLQIAVSTGGSSPIVAKQVRAELETLYGDGMVEYLKLLKTWRPIAKSRISIHKRKLFWDKVTDGEVLRLIKEQHLSEAKGVIEQCFQSLLD